MNHSVILDINTEINYKQRLHLSYMTSQVTPVTNNVVPAQHMYLKLSYTKAASFVMLQKCHHSFRGILHGSPKCIFTSQKHRHFLAPSV